MDLRTKLVDHLMKTKKEYKSLKKQKIHNIFIKTNWKKFVFQHEMTYGDFKDIPRKTASDKVLRDQVFKAF